ncbi:MAG: tRNA (N6-threonylcarbamoyladenosine(37)-N6)-methyltransferase TrmO, partial [Candidatus Bipolaricaulia bacterium]
HSPFHTPGEAPRQGVYTQEISTIEVFEEFAPALKGLESFAYLIVLYWADRAARDVLKSRRHKQHGEDRGVFASRSPVRPNPICFSVCEVVELKGNWIRVRRLEALDGTPLLDIKPFVRELDCPG